MTERDRTMMPRTTPMLRSTRWPSSSNCVVVMLWGIVAMALLLLDKLVDLFEKLFHAGAHLFPLFAQGHDLGAQGVKLARPVAELFAQARHAALRRGAGRARRLELLNGLIDLFFQRREVFVGCGCVVIAVKFEKRFC